MLQTQSHYLPPSPPVETIPPIPPRTRSRPPSRQQTLPPVVPKQQQQQQQPSKTFLFRIDDLPSPDREWQLFENIGDGTYGEVFRVRRFH